MGFFSSKLFGNENSMGIPMEFSIFFLIYFYDKLTVTMQPVCMFMNNIAVLCMHMIREKFLFILNYK